MGIIEIMEEVFTCVGLFVLFIINKVVVVHSMYSLIFWL